MIMQHFIHSANTKDALYSMLEETSQFASLSTMVKSHENRRFGP